MKISGYSKLKDGPMRSDKLEEKSYLSEMAMQNARTNFRIRSKMIDVKMNQRSDKANAKKLWKCSECGNVDSQNDILCVLSLPHSGRANLYKEEMRKTKLAE